MAKVTDYSQQAWVRDITAVLGTHKQIGVDLHVFLKNLACHYILEQYKEDPTRTEFDINIAPYGMAKLVRNGDDFTIKDIEIYPAFKKTLINTIKTGESNLYRQEYKATFQAIKNQLEAFSKGGNTDG